MPVKQVKNIVNEQYVFPIVYWIEMYYIKTDAMSLSQFQGLPWSVMNWILNQIVFLYPLKIV